MPRFDGAFAEVKKMADLLEIIQAETGQTAKRSGKNYLLPECPFCRGHGCFSIVLEKQFYNCFQCPGKAGGDVFDFLCKLKGWDKSLALRELAGRVGYQFPEPSSNQKRDLRELIMAQAKADWNLPEAKEVWDYLVTERELSPEVLKQHDVGYMRDRSDLIALLKNQGYTYKEIKAAGILTKSYGDFYRILFGWRGLQGRLIGFVAATTSARLKTLTPEQKDDFPKYKNEFDFKVDAPFNLRYAKHRVPEDRTVNVVEGIVDCLQMLSKGFQNTVALGTNRFWEGYGDALAATRFERVILVLDSDRPGRDGTYQIIQDLLTHYPQLKVYVAGIAAFDPAEPSKAIKDPDELIKKLGPEFARALVREPLKAGPWLALYLRNKYDVRNNLDRDRMFQEISKFWPLIADEVEKKETIRYLASWSELPQEDIRKTIERAAEEVTMSIKGKPLKENPAVPSGDGKVIAEAKTDVQIRLKDLKERNRALSEQEKILFKAYASVVHHIRSLSKGGFRWHINRLTEGHLLIVKRLRKNPKEALNILQKLDAIFAESRPNDLDKINQELAFLCQKYTESLTEEKDEEGVASNR